MPYVGVQGYAYAAHTDALNERKSLLLSEKADCIYLCQPHSSIKAAALPPPPARQLLLLLLWA
jgi:hypothetical protein